MDTSCWLKDGKTGKRPTAKQRWTKSKALEGKKRRERKVLGWD